MVASATKVSRVYLAWMDEGPLLDGKKKVFIQRDYTQGIHLRFSSEFPEEFIRKIDEEAWRDMIKELNAKLSEAQGVNATTYFETILGCLSCYAIKCCMTPVCEKKLIQVGHFIDELNQDVLLPRGIHMGNPMERGFRCIEMTLINESVETTHSQQPSQVSTPLQPRL